jgi:hypothetical protein
MSEDAVPRIVAGTEIDSCWLFSHQFAACTDNAIRQLPVSAL